MDEPKPLDSLFKEKIFRIPDYQRGYAWQKDQLKDFWEDLVNLSEDRHHYTGVLTLKQIATSDVAKDSKEFWLVDDHSYKLYHIVDGQQRLTTFVVFLQSLVEQFQALPENEGRSDDEIYVSESLNLQALQSRFLFKCKPKGDQFRTYKFGYTADNPSYDYLRYKVFKETGGGAIQETFYTLNLSNAKLYFSEQLRDLYDSAGLDALYGIYRKLTRGFLFNEYVIRDEFDVFVAFETMNNRGKRLSDLELLKNRLIYLTTLYSDQELGLDDRKSLRDTINDGWREVYSQLGRNKARPLNDDDFLRAHWTMYFKYSRKTGKDYIHFLLDEQFTSKKVHKKVERFVELELSKELSSTEDFDDLDDDGIEQTESETVNVLTEAQLSPKEISEFVFSIKNSAVHWYNSWNPYSSSELTKEEQIWIDRLNRIGLVYFRPLVMAILKSKASATERVEVFRAIERFIFITFRMMSARANYGSSEFYNAARLIDQAEWTTKDVIQKLNTLSAYAFNSDGTLRLTEFHSLLRKKFAQGTGYYTWSGIRYFLYEYELSLLNESRQEKVHWDDLLRKPKDNIYIEHIFPQTQTEEWSQAFSAVPSEQRSNYAGSLGNLLLLSMAINSSLQNDGFPSKKKAKYDQSGRKIRNGYSDGSHSEIEVSECEKWEPLSIQSRGDKLLQFMEKRWGFSFQSAEDRHSLLFLDSIS